MVDWHVPQRISAETPGDLSSQELRPTTDLPPQPVEVEHGIDGLPFLRQDDRLTARHRRDCKERHMQFHVLAFEGPDRYAQAG
jgi:hypothetical protein